MGGWAVLLLEDLSGAERVPPWTDAAIAGAAASLGRLQAAASPPGVQAYRALMLGPTLRWFAGELALPIPAGMLPAAK